MIEDDFPQGRPAWHLAGAQMVADVERHELMKIRCLNGTHSALAYLGYLAFRIALAGSKISFIEMIKAPGFMTGMTLQFINPKAYAVHTTFFTGFAFYPDSFTIEISLKFLIMNFIWIILHLAWLYAGCKIHELNLSSSAQKWVNLLMAASLCGIVVLSIGSI